MTKKEKQSESKGDRERIQKGIKAVSDVLVKIAQGDFSSYCELTGEENFDVLVLGVNMMISDLKEYTDNLKRTVSELKEKERVLQEKTKELEKFNRLFIERELRIAELKKEIKELKMGSEKSEK